MKTKRQTNRRGFAMVIAAMFCVLFMTVLGVAWRQMASTIGTFSVRCDYIQQDQGAVMAMAEAMRALEVGPPPFSSNPTSYTCYCTINNVPVIQDMKVKYPNVKDDYPESTKTCHYEVKFERKTAAEEETPENDRVYTVTVTSVTTAGSPVLNINDFGRKGPF